AAFGDLRAGEYRGQIVYRFGGNPETIEIGKPVRRIALQEDLGDLPEQGRPVLASRWRGRELFGQTQPGTFGNRAERRPGLLIGNRDDDLAIGGPEAFIG